jgi:hypothetical protein
LTNLCQIINFEDTISTNNIFPDIPPDSLYSFIIKTISEKKIGGKSQYFGN